MERALSAMLYDTACMSEAGRSGNSWGRRKSQCSPYLTEVVESTHATAQSDTHKRRAICALCLWPYSPARVTVLGGEVASSTGRGYIQVCRYVRLGGSYRGINCGES